MFVTFTSREPIDVITIGSYLFCGEYVLVSFSLFGWPLSISPEERESHQTARRHIRLQWQPHRILHYHFTRPAYTFDISYYTTPSIIIITPRRIKFSEWPDGTTQKPVIALVQFGQFSMDWGLSGKALIDTNKAECLSFNRQGHYYNC